MPLEKLLRGGDGMKLRIPFVDLSFLSIDLLQ